MVDITKGYGLSGRMFGMRAFAYSITSWTFENNFHPVPSPKHIEYLMQLVKPEKMDERTAELKEIWNKVCNKTETILENEITKSKLTYADAKDLRQAAFRTLSNEDPIELAKQLMKAFEMEFELPDRESWIASYNLEYPK